MPPPTPMTPLSYLNPVDISEHTYDRNTREIAEMSPRHTHTTGTLPRQILFPKLCLHLKKEGPLPWNKYALLALCNPDTWVTPRVVFTRSSSVIISTCRSGSVPKPTTEKEQRGCLGFKYRLLQQNRTEITEAKRGREYKEASDEWWSGYLLGWKGRTSLCSAAPVILEFLCPFPPYPPFIMDWGPLIQNPQSLVDFRFRMYHMLERYYVLNATFYVTP